MEPAHETGGSGSNSGKFSAHIFFSNRAFCSQIHAILRRETSRKQHKNKGKRGQKQARNKLDVDPLCRAIDFRLPQKTETNMSKQELARMLIERGDKRAFNTLRKVQP